MKEGLKKNTVSSLDPFLFRGRKRAWGRGYTARSSPNFVVVSGASRLPFPIYYISISFPISHFRISTFSATPSS